MDLTAFLTPDALAVLVEVIMIDLVLAGDNAVVVGTIAAGLPKDQQKKVVLVGVGAALVLRILFALAATQLLNIVGLLLLWVAWKMWRELHHHAAAAAESGLAPARSFGQAAWAVALADVSMSLDNVLGVAGAAREHPTILVFGLVFSVAVMGIAAGFIARVIDRYRWIAWIGLAVIVWVALKMIHAGLLDRELGLLSVFA